MSSKKSSQAKDASLIVKSAIRKYVNSKGCNVSSEVINKTLNNAVKKLLDKGIEHAKSQNRKTIKSKDISV